MTNANKIYRLWRPLSIGIGSQEWTLTMLGNWETTKRDDDGSGSYSSAETETRTHNKANEILSRIPNSVTLPFVYDDAGNLKEENFSASASHLFEHDSWNRLVKHSIDGVSTVVNAEYEYNGLHWRTIKRLPPNSPYGISNEGGSATVGILRKMYYSAAWQLLEEQIDTDYTGSPGTNRTCQQVWGARYIDDPVMRGTDSTPGGAFYHITDHQFSTIAIVNGSTGRLVERVRYDAYGRATHRWPHDFDDDGYATLGNDYSALYTLAVSSTAMSSPSYDPNMDLDRDGIIGSSDDKIWDALGIRGPAADGEICGRGYNGVDNVVGYCGYIFAPEITGGTASQKYCVRFRWYDPTGGRWMERDPLGHRRDSSLYQYVRSQSSKLTDPSGLDPDLWTFSGINHDCDYLAQFLAQSNLTSVREWYSKLGTKQSFIDSGNYIGIPRWGKHLYRDSEKALNNEATKEGDKHAAGDFCKNGQPSSIRLIMLAPKTHTVPAVCESCCKLTTTVYWSSADNVPNQGIFNSKETQDFWSQWSDDVRHVDTTTATGGQDPDLVSQALGATCPNHALATFMRDLPILEGPSDSTPPSAYVPTDLDHAMHGLYRGGNKHFDKVIVCHSQGCNAAMSVINKACSK